MLGSFCLNVIERVGHDVVDVVIGYCVDDLTAALCPFEQVCIAQNSKVLRDQWLCCSGRIDQLMHTARTVDHRHEKRKAKRVSHCL